MADVFPVIPEELPAQVVESIGRSPEFVFHEDGRSGSFPLVDGALVERQGIEAVKQWLELMLRQKPRLSATCGRPLRSARPSGRSTVLSLRACGAAWRYASRSACTAERVRR